MKRLLTIVLLLCAAGLLVYLFASRHSSPKTPSSSSMNPAAPSASASAPVPNFSSVSADLVHQLPGGSSGVVFIDVAALRSTPFSKSLAALAPTSAQDPQYVQFVQATGFDFSRDLDRVAAALWPQKDPTSILAIAEGRFDRRKIMNYALQTGRVVREDGKEVYEVPESDSSRTIRFAFLAPNRIAIADGPALSEVLVANPTNQLDASMAAQVATVSRAPIYAVAHTQNLASDLGIDPAHSAELAKMLGNIHTITLSGQPAASSLDVAAAAECDSTIDAFQLSTVLDGLRWMGRAALADPHTQQQIGPQWQSLDDLLKAASISHDGHFVRMKLNITPSMLEATSASSRPASAK